MKILKFYRYKMGLWEGVIYENREVNRWIRTV